MYILNVAEGGNIAQLTVTFGVCLLQSLSYKLQKAVTAFVHSMVKNMVPYKCGLGK